VIIRWYAIVRALFQPGSGGRRTPTTGHRSVNGRPSSVVSPRSPYPIGYYSYAGVTLRFWERRAREGRRSLRRSAGASNDLLVQAVVNPAQPRFKAEKPLVERIYLRS